MQQLFGTSWCHPGGSDTVVATAGSDRVTLDTVRRRIASNAERVAESPLARWAPCGDDALEFGIALLAILAAGKTAVVAPPALAASDNPGALGIDAVLSGGGVPEGVANAFELEPHGVDRPLPGIPGDARVELFTSGSTAKPKRVAKRFRQFTGELAQLESAFGDLMGSAPVLSTVPHFHIYGLLFRVLWPLASSRVFQARQTLVPWSEGVAGAALVTSPAFLKRLSDPAALAPARPRVIFSSGGALAAPLAREIARASTCPLIEVYGSTETGGIAWRKWPESDGNWQPFGGVETDYASGANGGRRLRVRSAATDDEWLDTGDAVEPVSDGFDLLGRADGVVKVEDKRVSFAALEACLEAHERVEIAQVVMLHNGRDELGAVVQLRSGETPPVDNNDRRELVGHLKSHLLQQFDPVVTPRRWRFVSRLPVNELGKVNRQELVALFQ